MHSKRKKENSKMPFVSIIIAAFNAETYIPSCLEAILNQKLTNVEVLIVDDGSTDSTASLCDKYATRDLRIKVFHEPHKGVAHARQVGIDHASGKYTIHIDADDQFEATMLEEMFKAAENTDSDILICDYNELRNTKIVYHSQKPSALKNEEIANDLITGKLYGALWNKMIRTSSFKDNHVRFREVLRMREDIFFILDLLPHVKKIAYLPKAFYTYNRISNNASLTNKYLTEDKNYYDQEIRWCLIALENPLVSEKQKTRLRISLLNYAYVTLSGQIYNREEWFSLFSPHKSLFKTVNSGYKKIIVILGLSGHFRLASIIRRLITFIKK